MATITALVKTVHADKKGKPVANVQDVDTKQYVIVYAKKDGAFELDPGMIGKTIVFKGTLMPLFDGVKLIATEGNEL